MVEYSKSDGLDLVFSALADPTRRAILRTLTRRPAIMVLERAGLLRREIKGRQHHCRIEPSPLRQADAWMAHYRQFWDERLDALAVYVDKKFKAAKMKKGSTHGNVR
jgi:DNA-binding transcriptional ArsR family regulator